MMRAIQINHSVLFLKLLAGAVLALCLHTAAAADTPDQNTAKAAPAAEETVTREPGLQEKLLETTDAIKAREKELKLLEHKIKTSKDQNFLKQAEQEATELKEIITDLKNQFIALAVDGADLYPPPKQPEQIFNWQEDLKTIAGPLLGQLKKITEHPRMIGELETNITYWSSRMTQLAESINNLKKNLGQVDNPKLIAEIKNLLQTAESRQAAAQQRLDLLNSELERLQKEGNPIMSGLRQAGKTIAVSMGLHLTAALAAALAVYYIIALIGSLPLLVLERRRPTHYIFMERLINLVKHMFGIIFAVFVYMMMLYSLSEWIILGISLVLLAAALMGLRNTVPQYLVQIRTLLNIGSVRQGERLNFGGIPWRISRLDVYTHLHNPLLDGHLRVSLTDLCRLTSRPYHEDEPWFPTNEGDVVIMEDQVFGTVIRQTPDIVQLDFGGSVYTYPTARFLENRPRNLTKNGFTVFDTFGMDYSHQAIITSDILTTYRQELATALAASPFAQHNTLLNIEFEQANTSSLDFKIIASFTGAAAPDFYRIKRFLQSASVEAANKHGWIIPFQQVTIHSS
jgi:predicted  nucleic acid-binding Zn-ribbon protein